MIKISRIMTIIITSNTLVKELSKTFATNILYYKHSGQPITVTGLNYCHWTTKCKLKPKFHYTDFHWNFPNGKVTNTNHLDMSRCLRQSPWQVRDKPICVALMEFSQLQCTGKVGNSLWTLSPTSSWTQIIRVSDAICVADFRDFCGLCCKVGVMEFGFTEQQSICLPWICTKNFLKSLRIFVHCFITNT